LSNAALKPVNDLNVGSSGIEQCCIEIVDQLIITTGKNIATLH
jgi:hypothetical protein